MPVLLPETSSLKFPSATGDLTVLEIDDASGNPTSSLDAHELFTVKGKVTMPDWMKGSATVTVYATEKGGPINEAIGSRDLTIDATPSDPSKIVPYDWTVDVVPDTLPDPQPGKSQIYDLTAEFVFGGQPTDIAGFVEIGTYLIN